MPAFEETKSMGLADAAALTGRNDEPPGEHSSSNDRSKSSESNHGDCTISNSHKASSSSIDKRARSREARGADPTAALLGAAGDAQKKSSSSDATAASVASIPAWGDTRCPVASARQHWQRRTATQRWLLHVAARGAQRHAAARSNTRVPPAASAPTTYCEARTRPCSALRWPLLQLSIGKGEQQRSGGCCMWPCPVVPRARAREPERRGRA